MSDMPLDTVPFQPQRLVDVVKGIQTVPGSDSGLLMGTVSSFDYATRTAMVFMGGSTTETGPIAFLNDADLDVGSTVWIARIVHDGAPTYLIIGAQTYSGYMLSNLAIGTALSGVGYDPTLHRLVDWKSTRVVTSAPAAIVVCPIPTCLGYTGAWAINGDAAANGATVAGIQNYQAGSFDAKLSGATAISFRCNFGLTYWVAL